MTKDNSKPTSPENLVKSSSTAPVELSETELEKVAGGRKAGGDQQEYLKIKLNDVLVSSGG
jgi:type VI protein secretion system component Hcp